MPHPRQISLGHEEHAAGVVASVYRDVRVRMEFVPAIFKALASDPEALVTAWMQARALYDDPRVSQALERLREHARPCLDYSPSGDVSATVAPFVDELPVLLLIVTSLGLTLDGVLRLRQPPPRDLPEPGSVPVSIVPEERGEHRLFDEIRAVYGTEHVPSMYRALAAREQLDEPWAAIGPFLDGDAGRRLVDSVETAAAEEAVRFPEVAFFAAERTRPVLDQFRQALPRNLIFALASSSR